MTTIPRIYSLVLVFSDLDTHQTTSMREMSQTAPGELTWVRGS